VNVPVIVQNAVQNRKQLGEAKSGRAFYAYLSYGSIGVALYAGQGRLSAFFYPRGPIVPHHVLFWASIHDTIDREMD
jgi:hypothetical protein